MEKTTIYIHTTKENLQNQKNDKYRTVNFIGGNKDMIDIIKKLIKDKYQA